MLGQKAEFCHGLLALYPAGHTHGVALQKLWRYQRGAASLGQPLPCLLVDVLSDQRLAVLLNSGEHFGRLRHRLTLQLGSAVIEADDRQRPFAGIALRNLVC